MMSEKQKSNYDEEFNMPEEKAKYLDVLEYAHNNNILIKKHEDFQKCYTERYNEKAPSQSSVSEKFQKFGIIKNSDGIYEYVEPAGEKTYALQYVFSTNCNGISKIKTLDGMYMFRVRTDIGSEHLISKTIYDSFDYKKYFAIIPSFGSVVVICSKDAQAKAIQKFIQKNMNHSFDNEQ